MELQGEEGALISVEEGCRKELGRGPVIASRDPTVSRRQVIIELQKENDGDDEEGDFNRVYVEVLGPNPICIVRSGSLKQKSSLEFLKKGQSSYLQVGDKFSLSVKNTHFFTLKKKVEKGSSEEKTKTGNEDEDVEKKRIEEAVARRQRRAVERKQKEKLQGENQDFNKVQLDEERGKGKEGPRVELELEEQDETEIQDLGLLQSLDLSHIDPVAEFGFLVEGSEFEQYGKRRVHDVDRWDLFLGKDPEKSSEDEDEDFREEKKLEGKKGKHKKKREAKDKKEDEDWTGEGEEETTQINKLKGSKKPKAFKTRTSSRRDSCSTVLASTGSNKKQLDDDIDENDETLGGFIVDDEVETTDDEEEEEEFQLTEDDSKEGDEDKDDMEDEHRQRNSSKERKPLCKYGTQCYRKNKQHLEEFRHTQ